MTARTTRWFAVAAVAIAAASFVAVAAAGIGDNLIYSWAPKDLRAAGARAVGATVRLGGLVAPSSIRNGERLEFDVTDGVATVRVQSRGLPPQLFREGVAVVVEGTLTPGGIFEGERLMVSHDNRYRER